MDSEKKTLSYAVAQNNDAVCIDGVIYNVDQKVCELIMMLSNERDALKKMIRQTKLN